MPSTPAIELVCFPSEDVARLDLTTEQYEELAVVGVPVGFLGLFTDVPALSVLAAANGYLVWFGGTGLDGRTCLEPRTGYVWELIGSDVRVFMNTSLSHFRRTAEAVAGRFPFHAAGAELEEREQGAAAVAEAIARIDPPAMEPDLFWSTLVDDICIGDFDEEVIASLSDEP